MATREQHTFCRICEPLCGMVATVEDGVLVQVRPDKVVVMAETADMASEIDLETAQEARREAERVLETGFDAVAVAGFTRFARDPAVAREPV